MTTRQKQSMPALKFPEFNGKWNQRKIGDFAKLTAGGTPSTIKPEYWGGNIRWMNSGELNLKKVFDVQNRITEAGLKNSSTKIIPKHSILIGLAGQGKTRGTVAMNMIELCTNQSIASIFPKPDVFDSSFLYYDLDRKYEYLRKLSTGDGGRGGLNLRLIKSLVCHLPSPNEQQKIASFLSSVDKKIEQLGKKNALLEQYKKGIMQKLFSQEIHFKDEQGNEYPDWEEKILGRLVKITTGKLDANAMVENGAYRFYTCAKQFFKIDRYAFDTDALLISGNGANVGYIHHYNGKFNAYQRTYVLDNFSENISYVKCYLDYFLRRRIDIEKKDGNTPYIVMSTLSDMKIKIPKTEEQQKIATFLSAIDRKIELVGAELELAQTFKKGLLQQMFI